MSECPIDGQCELASSQSIHGGDVGPEFDPAGIWLTKNMDAGHVTIPSKLLETSDATPMPTTMQPYASRNGYFCPDSKARLFDSQIPCQPQEDCTRKMRNVCDPQCLARPNCVAYSAIAFGPLMICIGCSHGLTATIPSGHEVLAYVRTPPECLHYPPELNMVDACDEAGCIGTADCDASFTGGGWCVRCSPNGAIIQVGMRICQAGCHKER